MAEKEGIRLIPDPERPKSGENVFVRCIVLDKSGFPMEGGEVNGLIIHPNGQRESLRFAAEEEGPGVYLGSFKAREPGDLRIEVETLPAERELDMRLKVERQTKEKLGQPVVSSDLLQLARLTGGKSVNYQEYEEVTQALSFLPDPQPVIQIYRLRTDTTWGLFLFGLLAIYWTGRKVVGMI